MRRRKIPPNELVDEAFRAGLALDNSSAAAGNAFDAVSLMHRDRLYDALDRARAAAADAIHGSVWVPLRDVLEELLRPAVSP